MKEKLLVAKALRKTFHNPTPVEILKGINLEVSRGETVAILGRSGQGKSTLLQILGTLEKPTSGTLQLAGQQVTLFNKSKIRNRHLAFVFQSFHLLEDYTALENVLMPARIARADLSSRGAAMERAHELLSLVGLSERTHFNAKLLSGGEKQRVAIARALCNDPDLLFADEPSGNLDKQTSKMIHELLIGFAKKSEKALILVTHDLELASLCDRRCVLEDGVLNPT